MSKPSNRHAFPGKDVKYACHRFACCVATSSNLVIAVFYSSKLLVHRLNLLVLNHDGAAIFASSKIADDNRGQTATRTDFGSSIQLLLLEVHLQVDYFDFDFPWSTVVHGMYSPA